MSAPGEGPEEVLSDRGSTPLTSTIISQRYRCHWLKASGIYIYVEIFNCLDIMNIRFVSQDIYGGNPMIIDGATLIVGGLEIHLFWIVLGILVIAYYIGIFSANQKEKRSREIWQKEREQIVNKYLLQLKTAAEEKAQSAPWLAGQFAYFLYMYDQETAKYLSWKKRPAIKASQEVSKIAKEKRILQKENKMLQYQLSFYESAFPWLEDFKEVDAVDAWKYARGVETDDQSEYEQLKNWLSPEEYQKLPTNQKYQLALDRYNCRKKSNWEIGIDFERYIGYQLEESGYKVKYQGALLGLEDMGRDLLAAKGKTNLVVQCKRWAKEKTIHEKHIFQLYGSVVLMATENKLKEYKGVFVTTTALSDVAKRCADYLGITVVENCEMKEYPMIKCNVSKNGEKIYHLPFDQQYDRVEISTKDKAFYTKTVSEAENLGFRRAYRWNPNKKQ